MRHTRLVLWAAIIVFPPLGLGLWWTRRGVGPAKRIAGTLGICAVAIIELFAVYGMRLEWNGALKISGITFETRAKRDARLEAFRARRMVVPASAAAPVSPPPPAPERNAGRATPPYWIDFRGPNRAGVYAETEIETAWPATGLPRLWKQPVGGGYASFTVAECRAYTIEQRRDREA